MRTEEEMGEAARERAGVLNHAKNLAMLQSLSRLHANPLERILYALNSEKRLEQEVVI